MKKGFDGARDHHGDLLPELSASASRMKYEKLVNTPLQNLRKIIRALHFSWNSDISC